MKTLNDVKNKSMKNRAIKIVALVIIVCTMLTSMVGCGFAGPTRDSDEYSAERADDRYTAKGGKQSDGKQYEYNAATLLKNNCLLVEWDNRLTTCTTEGHPTPDKKNGIWSVSLESTYDYGINSSEGMTFLRDIAILMYEAIFSANGGYGRKNDFFASHDDMWAEVSLDPADVTQIINEATLKTLSSKLGKSDTPADETDGTTQTFSAIMSSAQTMAAGILIAVWSIGFISQIVNEKFTMDTMLKTFMQLLCGILIINNSDRIVWAFLEAGHAMAANITDDGGGRFMALAEQMKKMLTTGILSINVGLSLLSLINLGIATIWIDIKPLIVIIFLAVPFYAVLRCVYQIATQMIMRIFELLARVTLAPIPLAFSMQNGFSHETIRYFREILACAMQPVLILIGVAGTDVIAELMTKVFAPNATVTDGPKGLLGVVAVTITYFILSAFIGETKKLSQEIIGH